MANSRQRHLAKTITWRIIGTMDTVLVAWLISGNPMTGFKIGATEVITKMVLYYFHERIWYKVNFGLERRKEKPAKNIISQEFKIDRENREALLGQRPLLIWFTGLSGSGKSTMANLLEAELHARGFKTYILDGDNVRRGLCKDLTFTEEDRIENIRRIGEVSRLFMDAGLIVLSSFVSPFQNDRERVRQLVGSDRFVEVFVDCPLEICEKRDVKGLYKMARRGEVNNFTGIDSPYENPTNPDIVLKTAEEDPQDLLNRLLTIVEPKITTHKNGEV
tara:strand:+ start:1118 stop:1945 length:828 start_codon:yes stop_codon:yes gene_type:complete